MKSQAIRLVLPAMALLAALPVQASLTIDYSVDGWGPENYKLDPGYPGDTVEMLAYSASGLILPDNTPVTAKINTLRFNVDYSSVYGSSYGSTATHPFTADRTMTITAPATGGETISQAGSVNVTADFDWVSLEEGVPAVFNFPGLGTVTVTPLALSTGNVGTLGDHFYDVEASILFTPVPEPSTYIAGASLLVPFGIGAFRGFRRRFGGKQ